MTGQLLRKTLKILAISIVAILGVLFLIMLYFNSTPGQKRLSNLIFNRLSKQIGTPVEGRLSFSIPDWVRLEDLLLRDQTKDTLLYAQRAHLDVGLWKLFNNELLIEQVELENAFVQLKKKDKKFNFDYLLEAFSSDTPSAPADTSKTPLQITLSGIDLKQIRVNYTDEDIDQQFRVRLGHLVSGLHELDLQNSIFDLKDTEITGLTVLGKLGTASTDTSASGPLPQVKIKSLLAKDLNWDLDLGEQQTSGAKAQVALQVKDLDLPNMAFEIASLKADAETLRFSQKNAPAVPQGEINYSDLSLSELALTAENVLVQDSVMALDLKTLRAKEQSGIVIENLSGQASLKGQTALLENIALKTPGSALKATGTLQIDSTAFMKSKLDVVIPELKVAVKEAFYFASSLKQTLPKSHQDVLTGKGRIRGSIQDMQLDHVYLTATANTRVTLDGSLHFGEVFGLNMKVKDFSTTPQDLSKYVTLPDSMRLPEQMVVNGNVSGNMENLVAEVFLNSSYGGALKRESEGIV